MPFPSRVAGVAALLLVAAIGAATPSYAQMCTTTPQGAVSWIPADGQPDDLIAGAATASPGSATYAPGKVNAAFSFDGVNDAVVALPGSVQGTADFSVEFWIRTSSGREESIVGSRPFCDDSGITSLNDQAGHDFAGWWEIRASAGVRFEVVRVEKTCVSNGLGSLICTSTRARGQVTTTRTVNDGQYHHIAATRHGSTLELYVDGVLDATNDTTTVAAFDSAGAAVSASFNHDAVDLTTSVFHSTTQTIGGGPGAACTAPFTGQLDEVTFYNRAIGAGEAARIAAAGSAGKCKSVIWGYGYSGQLGGPPPGQSSSAFRPQSIGPAAGRPALPALTAMAGGMDHVLALQTDGTVLAWGGNGSGQLGSGNIDFGRWEALPVVVDAQHTPLTNVIAIAANWGTSYALRSDGTVWTWGGGQGPGIAYGTTSAIAVQIPGLTGVIAIAAAQQGGLALRCDGTVAAWGNNGSGLLGDNPSYPPVPAEIVGLDHVVAIAAGSAHGIAVKADGTVWTWGDNQVGQLGDVGGARGVPQPVMGVYHVVAVSASSTGFFSLALKSDGTVLAWGHNDSYQLGDGTTTTRYAPVAVQGLPAGAVTAIAAGMHSSLALLADGTVLGWGRDVNGEVGLPLLAPLYAYPSPTPIVGGMSGISAGPFNGMAFTAVRSAVPPMAVCGACVAPPSDLIAWYAGEDDGRDSTDHHNDAGVHGVLFGPGRTDRGFIFNGGGSSYLELPSSLFPFPTSGAGYSVDAWFATTGSGPILVQQNGPFDNFTASTPTIYVGTDGRLYAQAFYRGGGPFQSRTPVADGAFHHVALTYDGATERVFLDGLQIGSSQAVQYGYGPSYSYTVGYGYTGVTLINNGYAFWPATFTDGAHPYGGFQSFDGVIDELHVYDHAISDAEVASLYIAGAAGFCRIVPPTTPVIAWTNPAAITYGTALDGTQLNATASVPGTFAYDQAAGTVLGVGTHTLNVTFTPDDTVRYTTATASVSITVTHTSEPAATTTTISSSLNPSTVLEAFTVTVSVRSGATPPVPDPANPFSLNRVFLTNENDEMITSLNLDERGMAIYTFPPRSLSAATHTITAHYTPVAGYASSSASLTQTVTLAPTTTTLVTSPNPSTVPESVTVTVRVVSGTDAPVSDPSNPLSTNHVNLTNAQGNLLTVLTLDDEGRATHTFPPRTFGPGSETITASYVPVFGYSASSASVDQTVRLAPTTTTITSSSPTSTVPEAVTVTVTVSSGATPPALDPFNPGSHNRVFLTNENGDLLTSLVLDAQGSAVYTFAPRSLGPGTHTITAHYTPVAGYEASSASLTQTVTLAPTTTTITTSPNPSSIQQAVVVTVTVLAGTAPPLPNPIDPSSRNRVNLMNETGGLITVLTLDAQGTATYTIPRDTFTLGTHTITAGYSPVFGYELSSASASQVVRDMTAPVLSLPETLVRQAKSPAGAPVSYTVSAHDDVDGARPVTCLPESGLTFPIGETTVVCSTSDASNNQASGTFTVTVTDAPPAFDAPADITTPATQPGGIDVTFPTPAATDFKDGTVAVVCAPASGSRFPIGPTTVTCTATNSFGMTTTRTFTVTVLDTPPTFAPPAGVTVTATSAAGAPATYATPTAQDLKDKTVPVTCTPASGSTFAIGATTVSCSATNSSGMTTIHTFGVVVLDAPPVLAAPPNIVVPATDRFAGVAIAVVTYATPTATDFKDGTAPVACGPASGSSFMAGTTTVTCAATNRSGMTTTRAFTITVTIKDAAPQAIDQELRTDEATPLPITLSAADADGNPLTFTVTKPTTRHGALSGIAPNLVYSPAAGFFGEDKLTFEVSDGRRSSKGVVTIHVGRVIRYSTDITVDLGTVTATDRQIVEEDTSTGTITPVLRLPANVDGYQRRADGVHLVSFDITTTLGGVTVGPADVVAWDGTNAAIVFDAHARGIPNGVNVDALGVSGTSLLLSFDTTVALSATLTAGPRDVVLVTATGFQRFFDGAAAGLPKGIRITAADYDEAHDTLLLTFDGAATIGGVAFTKADIVSYDRTTHAWRMVRDGEARHSGLRNANIDALWSMRGGTAPVSITTTSIH